MHQKTQWTMAAVLAVGALLVAGARPAEAQVRIRLKGPVVSPLPTGTGIVTPPSTPKPTGIVIPPSNPTPPVNNALPLVTPPVNAPKPTTPAPLVKPAPTPPVQNYQPAPQGFSLGPSVLGVPRVPTGRVVNRVGPDINGDGWSDIHKDHRSK
jgi:hypothetical protein